MFLNPRLNIHYIHAKPAKTANKKVIPLLVLHGWPGSVREFYDFIPLLTTPSKDHDYVFEVVAPSLPGYGWSQGSSKKDFATAQIAVIARNLMLRLGHQKFLIQGGDWGSAIGRNIALIFPENTIGFHANMCGLGGLLSTIKLAITSLCPSYFLEEDQIDFHFPVGQRLANILEESGYFHIQATKPDTIGAVLLNNPVGLLAYILEKFSSWTNLEYRKLPDGGLEKRFTFDALLDNIMIYYLTNSITTSQRLYAEQFAKPHRDLNLDALSVTVPTACARFKHDLMHFTDWQLKEKNPHLTHTSYNQEGGHFAALEVPNVLYKDFVEFVKKLYLNKQKV